MKYFKAGKLKVFSYRRNKCFNGACYSSDKGGDSTENFIKDICSFNYFVKFNEPFSKRTSNAKKTASKFSDPSKKRTNSSDHCHKGTANDVYNSKQSLKSVFKIIRCGFA